MRVGERFRILGSEPASVIAVVRSRAYVMRKEQKIVVVDVTSGSLEGQFNRRFPTLLLPTEPAF